MWRREIKEGENSYLLTNNVKVIWVLELKNNSYVLSQKANNILDWVWEEIDIFYLFFDDLNWEALKSEEKIKEWLWKIKLWNIVSLLENSNLSQEKEAELILIIEKYFRDFIREANNSKKSSVVTFLTLRHLFPGVFKDDITNCDFSRLSLNDIKYINENFSWKEDKKDFLAKLSEELTFMITDQSQEFDDVLWSEIVSMGRELFWDDFRLLQKWD